MFGFEHYLALDHDRASGMEVTISYGASWKGFTTGDAAQAFDPVEAAVQTVGQRSRGKKMTGFIRERGRADPKAADQLWIEPAE